MPDNRYKRQRITNVSGVTMAFTLIPLHPGGATLANNAYVEVNGDWLAGLSAANLRAFNATKLAGYIRVESVPGVGVALDTQESIDYEADVLATNAGYLRTGFQATIVSSLPAPVKLVGGEFHVLGIPGGAKINANTTRGFAIYKGSGGSLTRMTPWIGLNPKGAGSVTAGTLVRITNVIPAACEATAGQPITLYSTGYLTGAQATGTVRVRFVTVE
ncbi:MAG: hypothetical protein ABIG68_05925 [Acidobacteriota bacterium]